MERDDMARHGIAEVGGTRLSYALRGSGTPVVLVHGFALDARMWAPQLPAFAPRHRVLTYDQRGYGGSDVPPVGAAVSHAQDLRALLDDLGLDRVSLVGSSMGGQNAVEFALRFPERVDRLVLAGAMLQGWPYSPPLRALFSRVFEAYAREGLGAAQRLWLEGEFFAASMDSPAAETLRALVLDYAGWHWKHRATSVPLRPPAREQLERIEAPTLLLVGERDVPDAHGVAELLAARLPRARIERLSGLGHMPNLEAPARFNEVVLDFLAEGEAAAG